MALAAAVLVATVGVYRTAQAGEPVGVPALPGVEERFEGLYDDDGCLRLGDGDRDCSVTAQEIDDVLVGDSVDDVRHLAGFTGSRWTDDVSAGSAVVLEDTVTVATGPEVELRGLVRNETTDTIDRIEVSATLRDAAGAVTARLTGPAAVGTVRSGEPVPFTLVGPAPGLAPDRIEWQATGVTAEPVARELEWQSYWEQPAGGREPVENHLYRESGDGPHPHVTFGAVRNVGPASSEDVAVVIAWMDEAGRVASVARSAVVDPTGAPVPSLRPGAMADALVTSADVPLGAEALTWVGGS